MALKGMYVPFLSNRHLKLSSKALATFDISAPYKCDRNLPFAEGRFQYICFIHTGVASVSLNIRRKWMRNSLVINCRGNNGSSDKSKNPRSDGPFKSSGRGRTRLIRIIQEVQSKATKKINELKKNFPMKVLCLLLGFYCATIVATSIGHTGDWDILSAGLAVTIVEAIGALMYRAYPFIEKVHRFVIMFNYWKAGLSLGLFLDAFKYELDINSILCDSFNFEINLFSIKKKKMINPISC
jgi:hypothetical protein